MKNVVNKLKFLLLVVVVLLSSCKEDKDNYVPDSNEDFEIANANGRLIFKDSRTLYKVLEHLQNKETQQLNKWEDEHNFHSFRRAVVDEENSNLSGFDFPDFYSTIINESGEYQIGDTIVWLNDGFKHFIPNNDEKLLLEIKGNPSMSKNKVREGAEVIKTEKLNVGVSLNALNPGEVDARYQKEFYTDDNGGRRKIIFEIHHYSVVMPDYNRMATLYTRIKLEYYGSKGWRPAGETMTKGISNLEYNIGYYSIAGYYYQFSNQGINVPTQTNGSNLEYTIFSSWVSGSKPSLAVYVNGFYSARVDAPLHSRGFYNIDATWQR